jgi:hypothetical protein
MRRREVLALGCGAATVRPLTAGAQHPGRMRRIGRTGLSLTLSFGPWTLSGILTVTPLPSNTGMPRRVTSGFRN